jgi:hypothetical protein
VKRGKRNNVSFSLHHGGDRLPAFNNECGYFRDQVNDGCTSGSLSGKTDFGFFFLSLFLLELPPDFHIYQTVSVLLSQKNMRTIPKCTSEPSPIAAPSAAIERFLLTFLF